MVFCGSLQSHVSAQLELCTSLSCLLKQILIPWEIPVFPTLPISLREESLPGPAAFVLLSLLLECYPLSLLRLPYVSKTLLASSASLHQGSSHLQTTSNNQAFLKLLLFPSLYQVYHFVNASV